MKYCAYCGSPVEDGVAFCTNCGAKQDAAPAAPAPVQQPAQQVYTPAYPAVAPVSTGGYIAWGIITLLLCTIPGIVALCTVGKINKATTVAEQEKAISTTKTWCLVGTILGVIALIITLASNS